LLSVEEVTLGDLGRDVPDFVSKAETIFGTPSWMEVGLRTKVWGGAFRTKAMLAREGADPCGFLLGCEFRIPGFKAFFSPLPRTASQYGGLSVLPEFVLTKERIIESLLWGVYDRYDLGFIITSPGHLFVPKRTPTTWIVIPRKSLVINLQQEKDDLWSSMTQQARYGVRRALRDGIKVDFVNDLEYLPSFMKMLTEVATRTDWDLPIGGGFFKDVLLRLKSNSIIVRASLDGESVGVAVLFYDNRTLYCHSLATSANGRKSGASSLLHWSIINWGKEQGLVVYDLMGANIPRIARFKRSFGATQIDYETIAFSRNPFYAHLTRRALDPFYAHLAERTLDVLL
jgi:hypothetical protein